MKKATDPKKALRLEEIPNVGKQVALDLKKIGIAKPLDLVKKNPYNLYVELCNTTKAYHDPCMLDTFMAAVAFMNGEGAKSWWEFTEERKKNFSKVEHQVLRWK